MGLWCLLIFIEVSLAAAAASAAATRGESLRYDEPKSGQVFRLPMASFPQTEPPCYQPIDTVGSLLFRGLPANRNSKGMPAILVRYKTETCFRFVGVYSNLQSLPSTREKNECMRVFSFSPLNVADTGQAVPISEHRTCRDKERMCADSFFSFVLFFSYVGSALV